MKAGPEVRLISIHLNGEAREVPDGLTLDALLERLNLPRDRLAVERNLEIVARDRWPETPVLAGDRFEVVHFVGGGSGDFGLTILDFGLRTGAANSGPHRKIQNLKSKI